MESSNHCITCAANRKDILIKDTDGSHIIIYNYWINNCSSIGKYMIHIQILIEHGCQIVFP